MRTNWDQEMMTNSLLSIDDGSDATPPEGGGEPAAPAAAEPAAPAAPESEGTDFAALADEIVQDELGEDTPPVIPPVEPPTLEQPPAVAEPPVVPATPAEPATPETPAELVAATPPAEPPAEPVPAEPAAPAAPEVVLTPENIEAAYTEFEKKLLPQLEKVYQLSEEQATELDENPSVAIPKIAARIHYQAQVAAYTGIMSQLPKIVSAVMERAREVEKAQGAFYTRWPDLDKPENQAKVDATLVAYRNANPEASEEDMREKAGVMAMLSLGLDPNAVAVVPANGAPPVVLGAPVLPAMPAAPGGAGVERLPDRGASSIFEQMADEIDEDNA